MPDTDFQKIELNLIPKKGDEPVVFYASQFETARPFITDLMWGDTEYAPGDDCRAEIDIRKNDDNLVVITDDVTIDNNEVSVILPVQALTCIGKNLGQVKIYEADDQLVAALNFILEVQPDPLAGGVTSETAIDNLTQQIEDITQEVIGDDYYNKTEVDTLLNAKADKTDTYTKAQVDSALAAKANTADLATVATTGDYDDLINKPTIPAAQVQSDYAQADNTKVDYIKNKPDINAMIAAALLAVMPVETQTGNPCSFDTDIATKLQGLTANIVATGGGGTPSTPIPIVGHSSLNLDVNGETFTVSFGQTVYGGVYDANRGKVVVTCGECDENAFKTPLPATSSGGLHWTEYSPSNYSKTGFNLCSHLPYKTTGQAWNSTTPCYAFENSAIRIYTNKATREDFITEFSGMQLVYPLATPIEIDVSSISVDAVVGTNTITSDCNGDVTASYKVSIQKYVNDQ